MTVFYLCPDWDTPSGGTRKIYRHVDILNEAGIPARVVHARSDFRLTWFTNRTPVLAPPIELGTGDLLAIPEVYGDSLQTISPGIARVSVNQNAYNTFRGVSDPMQHPYVTCNDIVAVMVVSDNNLDYIKFAFPDLDVQRIHLGFDPELYAPTDAERRRALGYMPRKRARLSDEVLRLLRLRGAIAGWEVVPLSGMNEMEVAATLKSLPLFLSFGEREGFAMPPAEALAAGCFVIGFDGFAGREYFDPQFTIRIEDGDPLSFAAAVATWTAGFEWNVAARERSRAASQYLLSKYSLAQEAEDIERFFSRALRAARERPAAKGVLTKKSLVVPATSPLRSPLRFVTNRVRRWLPAMARR